MTKTIPALATASALLLASACSESEDAVSGERLEDDDVSDPSPVVLDAAVREWGDVEIVVDYALRNGSGETIIVFNEVERADETVTRGLQSELNDDGDVRLFTGKSDIGGTLSVAPLTIPGLALEPGASIERTGSRPLPVTIDHDFDGALGPFMPDAIEFCVGHGRAEVELPTRREDGSYQLNAGLERQTLECVVLTR